MTAFAGELLGDATLGVEFLLEAGVAGVGHGFVAYGGELLAEIVVLDGEIFEIAGGLVGTAAFGVVGGVFFQQDGAEVTPHAMATPPPEDEGGDEEENEDLEDEPEQSGRGSHKKRAGKRINRRGTSEGIIKAEVVAWAVVARLPLEAAAGGWKEQAAQVYLASA
jgi:hypothetical protein